MQNLFKISARKHKFMKGFRFNAKVFHFQIIQPCVNHLYMFVVIVVIVVEYILNLLVETIPRSLVFLIYVCLY